MRIAVDATYLYKMGSNGKLQQWMISTESDEIIIEWGDFDGRKQTKRETVEFGLAGRTHEEQLLSRVTSRVNRKLDIGYIHDIEKAQKNKKVNRLGLKMPMLAKPYPKVKNLNFDGAIVQPKLDGHRCLIYFDGEDYIAYSRNGKPITSIKSILAQVVECGMQPRSTLDGELYLHGTVLQTIGSWVRREQPNTNKLHYIVYDIIPPQDELLAECDFRTRLAMLDSLRLNTGHLGLLGSIDNVTEDQIPKLLQSVRNSGYEGLIIRPAGFSYQDGKRNNALIKVKAFEDDEFEVVDIQESKDGFCILHCKTGTEITHVTAPGSFEQKRYVLENWQNYLHKFVTVEFAGWTLEGKLFHPVAKAWRENE